MLEYCIREDLKPKAPRLMGVLNPVKLVIDNYPEGQTEEFEIDNNPDGENAGSRKVTFSRELYIEQDDFMEVPPRKYFRLFPGNEVRLKGAYFVRCTECEKDAEGNVTVVHGTYDPETRSGSGYEEKEGARKVKGTIHWVNAADAVTAEVRLYENLIDEEKGKLNDDGTLNFNPNSLTVLPDAKLEACMAGAKPYERVQLIRNGYFAVDPKDSTDDHLVLNRIVGLKSSYKPGV
jgi:glutaminyl-tRNA synthetase